MNRPNCTLPEIFDLEDEANRNGMKTCDRFSNVGKEKKNEAKIFLRIYSNSGYEIYKIL